MKSLTTAIAVSLFISFAASVSAQLRERLFEIKADSVKREVPYCTNGADTLRLDLYFPKLDKKTIAPLVIYVHGGGWEKGSKNGGAWLGSIGNELLARGYIVAAVDYRLAPEHKWPAFINDVKCAVRFLRANAEKYHVDTNHIGTWGSSAGGHLVAMLGTSDAAAKLEGEHYLDQSSRVQAVVDFFGPSDLRVMTKTAQHEERGRRVFGDDAAIKEASPVVHVTKNDPPFLIIHGEEDALVHPEQAKILYDKLKETGVPTKLVMVKSGTHGLLGRDISPSRDEIVEMVAGFFDEYLRNPKN
jgi:acetyl esterase/lipase